VLALGDREHLLQLAMHHIVSDGWSMRVLVGELARLYAAASRRLPSPLAELPVQYGDFALWQRRWLTPDVLAARIAWWRSRLSGFPPVLELPFDRPRSLPRSTRGGLVALELEEELAAAVAGLGRPPALPGPASGEAQGVTPFMILLAAFAALLSRLSGQPRVVVGAPIAGRGQPETEALIGLFVNTLALPVDLTGNPSFRELLAQVRETALGAFAHQELPFERLVEELQPARSLAHSPLVQAMFALDDAEPVAAEILPGLTAAPLAAADVGIAKFDLTLTLSPAGRGLRGALEYSRDLYDASTARRLAGHLRAWFAGLAAEPGQPLSEVSLLTVAERHQLLREWNCRSRRGAAGAAGLHHLVARQAARTPDAVAVCSAASEQGQLTYRELQRRAGLLARRLCALGLQPEAPVGVFLERSPELVVGLLGALRAGGALAARHLLGHR